MLSPYGVKCLLHILLTSSMIKSLHSCLATGQGKEILVPSTRSKSTSTTSTTTTSPQTTTSPETTTATSTPLMTTTTSSTPSTIFLFKDRGLAITLGTTSTTTTTTTTSTTTTTTILQCMTGWTFFSFTNKCYKLFTTPVLQSQAETICINNGGHLVSIHSATEDVFVRTVIANFGYYWIGLFSASGCCAAGGSCCVGSYNWLDGTPFDYMGWVPNAPDASGGACVYVINVANHTLGWDNDVAYGLTLCPSFPCPTCTLEMEFVCESNLISVG
uniref:C-type lectin domain-containing protein n=1 Tax=Acrobeloides nanus TaxID=290746 RepID=A0A914DCH3_9BILA